MVSETARISRRAVIAGLSVFACASFGGQRAAKAVIDARTVDPMSLQVVDWLNLGTSDRGVFIKGFSAGWFRDVAPDSDEIVGHTNIKLVEAIDLQLTKLANKPMTAHVPLVAAFSRAALIGWLPPIEILGKHWKRLQMRHRVLVLRALVAGAHSRDVWRAMGEPEDSDTLSRGLSTPRRFAPSPLPLNPNLMLARLLDYYVDDERLELPLMQAVLKVDKRTAGTVKETAASRSTPPEG